MQEKLIVTIANETFENILRIASEYKQIELRLDKLNLSFKQINKIIEIAELVILTDISYVLDNLFCFHYEILPALLDNSKKIFIVINFEQLELFYKNYTNLSNIPFQKILSFHKWKIDEISIIDEVNKILNSIKNVEQFDLFKFAFNILTKEQLDELFSILQKFPTIKDKLILIPLGEKFKYERISFLKVCSTYMFCYTTQPVIEGQLSYDDYIFFFENNNK